ncbi:hypothetical protein FFLO_01906 [Filobasidium floriforme]|uniref:Uncharacterized protein n=1 Tax=Filobasidium floriforme TaxID=5210 RepID=A0A8K0NS84_9TREE|nr:uncharacterized protein HD553DRAFT_321578 [Filobasidium floriforme]KAG7562639.1 hypothetical protein FFLO_01906 [Filobasidium floriforme]KAH8089446.1 hypothetical protein HD553DRAFT_321578 [Filobasidium floriforme]
MAKEFLQKLNIQDDEIQSKKRVVTEIIEHRQEIGVLKEQNRALREENAVLKAAQKMNDDHSRAIPTREACSAGWCAGIHGERQGEHQRAPQAAHVPSLHDNIGLQKHRLNHTIVHRSPNYEAGLRNWKGARIEEKRFQIIYAHLVDIDCVGQQAIRSTHFESLRICPSRKPARTGWIVGTSPLSRGRSLFKQSDALQHSGPESPISGQGENWNRNDGELKDLRQLATRIARRRSALYPTNPLMASSTGVLHVILKREPDRVDPTSTLQELWRDENTRNAPRFHRPSLKGLITTWPFNIRSRSSTAEYKLADDHAVSPRCLTQDRSVVADAVSIGRSIIQTETTYQGELVLARETLVVGFIRSWFHKATEEIEARSLLALHNTISYCIEPESKDGPKTAYSKLHVGKKATLSCGKATNYIFAFEH